MGAVMGSQYEIGVKVLGAGSSTPSPLSTCVANREHISHYAQHRYKRLSRTKTDQSRGANAGHTVGHCPTPNNNRILTGNTTPAGCTQQHMGNTG